MPIRPELRKFYCGAEWRAVRARLLARANGRCEHCGRPAAITDKTRGGWWRLNARSPWRDRNGELNDPPPGYAIERTRAILTVAHLDHDHTNHTDDSRMACLCCSCHLRHDQKHHYASARRNRAVVTGQRWLSRDIAEAS